MRRLTLPRNRWWMYVGAGEVDGRQVPPRLDFFRFGLLFTSWRSPLLGGLVLFLELVEHLAHERRRARLFSAFSSRGALGTRGIAPSHIVRVPGWLQMEYQHTPTQ